MQNQEAEAGTVLFRVDFVLLVVAFEALFTQQIRYGFTSFLGVNKALRGLQVRTLAVSWMSGRPCVRDTAESEEASLGKI